MKNNKFIEDSITVASSLLYTVNSVNSIALEKRLDVQLMFSSCSASVSGYLRITPSSQPRRGFVKPFRF